MLGIIWLEYLKIHHYEKYTDINIDYKDEYTKLSKSKLVQDCRHFNDTKVKPKICIDLLNKSIFLLNQVRFSN